MAKKTKPKISLVKRGNQLRTKLMKQGKLKSRRNKPKALPKKPQVSQKVEESEEEQSDEGYADMIDEEDIEFLKEAVKNQSYTMAREIGRELNNSESAKKKRKLEEAKEENLEDSYAATVETGARKRTKSLLPIKTPHGLVERVKEIEDDDDDEEEVINGKELENNDAVQEINDAEEGDNEEENEEEEEEETKPKLSTADILANREELLKNKKFQIGILSTGLLENPEVKIRNFKVLLEMMDEMTPEIFITVRKLACVSLFEIFKDLLPSYPINIHDAPGVKLKKQVKQLHDYESSLLRAYKVYLQKLEKFVSILRRKKGDGRVFKEAELKLAEVGVQCLCDLLSNNLYFNFSKNIVHLIVPFLDCGRETVRQLVSKCIKETFKTDKRGEMSLEVVRKINYLVKNRAGVHCEVLKVLFVLKIKDVNLDNEKEQEMKEKKLNNKKHKIIHMSKKEKKRNKKLQELEQELLETKAEENKTSKQHNLTEITKIVFMIYFRILKRFPSSKLLSVTLEGLAKFAHCINIEFYHDLVNVLDKLIEENTLDYKEHNHCVQTVFTILSGQGDVLNIDPLRFYTHLYRNILQVNAGRNSQDLTIILKTLDLVLLKRRKKVSLQRLLAFVKRLSTLSLQVQHHGTLACLSIVKTVLLSSRAVDVLLDTDSTCGQGTYSAETNDPEYCNPSATALWELTLLQKHYHPTVRNFATKLSSVQADDGNRYVDVLQKTPFQLLSEFDPSNGTFRPPIPTPKKTVSKKRGISNVRIRDPQFEEYITGIVGNEIK